MIIKHPAFRTTLHLRESHTLRKGLILGDKFAVDIRVGDADILSETAYRVSAILHAIPLAVLDLYIADVAKVLIALDDNTVFTLLA